MIGRIGVTKIFRRPVIHGCAKEVVASADQMPFFDGRPRLGFNTLCQSAMCLHPARGRVSRFRRLRRDVGAHGVGCNQKLADTGATVVGNTKPVLRIPARACVRAPHHRNRLSSLFSIVVVAVCSGCTQAPECAMLCGSQRRAAAQNAIVMTSAVAVMAQSTGTYECVTPHSTAVAQGASARARVAGRLISPLSAPYAWGVTISGITRLRTMVKIPLAAPYRQQSTITARVFPLKNSKARKTGGSTATTRQPILRMLAR